MDVSLDQSGREDVEASTFTVGVLLEEGSLRAHGRDPVPVDEDGTIGEHGLRIDDDRPTE
jgi:hypothetical protein